jgi:hypothetical protein
MPTAHHYFQTSHVMCPMAHMHTLHRQASAAAGSFQPPPENANPCLGSSAAGVVGFAMRLANAFVLAMTFIATRFPAAADLS